MNVIEHIRDIQDPLDKDCEDWITAKPTLRYDCLKHAPPYAHALINGDWAPPEDVKEMEKLIKHSHCLE